MASLCLGLLASCWQEEAETEFATKTPDLEAFARAAKARRTFQRSAAADGSLSCCWEREAPLEADRMCLGV